jgi:hypothetical protein
MDQKDVRYQQLRAAVHQLLCDTKDTGSKAWIRVRRSKLDRLDRILEECDEEDGKKEKS